MYYTGIYSLKDERKQANNKLVLLTILNIDISNTLKNGSQKPTFSLPYVAFEGQQLILRQCIHTELTQ